VAVKITNKGQKSFTFTCWNFSLLQGKQF